MCELTNIDAYGCQDVHVWSAYWQHPRYPPPPAFWPTVGGCVSCLIRAGSDKPIWGIRAGGLWRFASTNRAPIVGGGSQLDQAQLIPQVGYGLGNSGVRANVCSHPSMATLSGCFFYELQ